MSSERTIPLSCHARGPFVLVLHGALERTRPPAMRGIASAKAPSLKRLRTRRVRQLLLGKK